MPLPKIDYPIHEIYLKSLGRKVKFRPFLVKEEKILLVAKESEEPEDIKTSIKQIIQNCCLEDIDVETLPLFDIEMFFVHLRSKSVGETAKLQFTCQRVIEETTICEHVTEYTIDLNKIEYIVPEGHTNKIKITEKVGVVFKYPTINVALDDFSDPYYATVSLFKNNIDYIYDEDSFYYRKDISDEELEEFLEQLSIEHVELIRNFFITTPRVALKDQLTCGKCGFEHTIELENLYSFFI